MDKKLIRQSSYDWSESVLGFVHLARYLILLTKYVWPESKSLWIKASAKCLNINVFT